MEHSRSRHASLKYDAFLSYSHDPDALTAERLRTALQRFAKPWFRLRAIRVYRDTSSGSATPTLWDEVRSALDQSHYLVLLASRNAAKSPWVQRELGYWLTRQGETTGVQGLLLVLTDGTIQWDRKRQCFDYNKTDALPTEVTAPDGQSLQLSTFFSQEPRYVDLSFAQESTRLTLTDPEFSDVTADLAAEIRNIDKDFLIGEDLREHRKVLRWITGAAIALAALLVATVFLAVQERNARQSAEKRFRIMEAGNLAMQARTALDSYPQKSLLLAIEAVNATKKDGIVTRDAEQILYDALGRTAGKTLTGHRGAVSGLAFDSRGRFLASSSLDGSVRIWALNDDLSPWKAGPLSGLETGALEVRVSGDGRFVAAGYRDGTVRLWSLDRNTAPIDLKGAGPAVINLSFDAANRLLAGAGSNDNIVHVWEVSTIDRQGIPPIQLQHKTVVQKLWFETETGRLWVVSGDNVYQWDLNADSGAETARILSAGGMLIRDVVVSTSGRWMAAAGQNGKLAYWDLKKTKAEPLTQVKLGEGELTAAVFSSKDNWLAAGSVNGTVAVWKLRGTSEEDPPVRLDMDQNQVNWLRFTPDENWLIAGSRDSNRIWMWPMGLSGPSDEPLILAGHDGNLLSLELAPEGDWLASAGYDRTIQLWDLTSRISPDLPFWLPNVSTSTMPFASIAVSGNGHIFSVADGTGSVTNVWDLSRPHMQTSPWSLDTQGSKVTSVALDHAGEHLMTGSNDGTVHLWDLRSGMPDSPARTLAEQGSIISSVALAPNGLWLAAGSADGMVRLWSHSADVPELRSPPHGKRIDVVRFDPRGRWLVSRDSGSTLRIWKVGKAVENPVLVLPNTGLANEPHTVQTFAPQGTAMLVFTSEAPQSSSRPHLVSLENDSPTVHILTELPDSEFLATAEFSQDSQFFAVGTYSNRIFLWHLSEVGSPHAARILEEHNGTVHALAFSHDNRRLASASSDGSVRFWDIKGSGKKIPSTTVITGLENVPKVLRFSPDGDTLIIVDGSSTIRLWSIADDRAGGQSLNLNAGNKLLNRAWLTKNNRWLVAMGSWGMPIMAWPMDASILVKRACLVAGRNLSNDEWLLHRTDTPYSLTCQQYPTGHDFVLLER
jgi:WD40 repeat protein